MRPRHPDPLHKMPLPSEEDFMNLVGSQDMEDADLEDDPEWDGLESDEDENLEADPE